MAGKANGAIVKAGALGVLKGKGGLYQHQVARFVGYIEEHGLDLSGGIGQYMAELKRSKHKNRQGREISYSAAWYNQMVKGVKWSVKYLLDYSPNLSVAQRWNVEQELKKLKRRTPREGIAKVESLPTEVEVRTLQEKADPRLRLMIGFLATTGARVSEMLSAEVGKARRGDRITRLEIVGKRGRERDLRLPTHLFDEIREMFHGSTFLFEHGGKRYSRAAVTNRIRGLAERTIGKSVTAHLLRHYRGTLLSQRFGISKAASELGHKNITTTKQFYDHTRLSDEEFRESVGTARS